MNHITPDEGWIKANVQGLPKDLDTSTWFVPLIKLDIRKYDRAVIQYWAPFSGPSVVAFKILTKKLTEIERRIPLLLVEWDNNSNNFEGLSILFGENIGGWGETCWILNGRIIGQDCLHRHGCSAKTPAEFEEIVDQRLKQLG